MLLALPAERVQHILRLQVASSERKVQVVFVIYLDVSVIPNRYTRLPADSSFSAENVDFEAFVIV